MIQRAHVRGHGNVTVQIVGENNQVTVAGVAALRLTMYPRRRRAGGEIGLLSPYTQSIDLVGRKAEMADLKAWLASERDSNIAVQVRTGKTGTGKTRLAFDLCDELQGGDWQAGFVAGEHLKNLVADAGARWGWDLPTLAVVDYAAQWADALRSWFSQLADFAPADAPPLRILLLERQAEVESGWLQAALGIGTSQERTVLEMLDPDKSVPVPGLEAPEHRRAVLDGMLTKLQSPLRTPAVGTDPDFDRRLHDLTWGGEPLFLMMAALLAAETSLPQVLALPRTEIAHKVAKREIGRIHGLAKQRGLAPELLVHMAAYVTLCQGLARNALLDSIDTEAAEFRWGVPTGAATVADTLADAVPGTLAAVEPIRPDALGEAVVLEALGDPRVDGAAVVARAYGQAGPSVAAFVVRTAQDFTAAGYEQPLAWLDRLVDREEVGIEQLMLLANTLPESSSALLEYAARLAEKLAKRLQDSVSTGDVRWLPVLAAALNDLGGRLSAVGQHREARGPLQEAVAIGRTLAATDPGAYESHLALSLGNLANCSRKLGQSEALGPAKEAAGLYRRLAAANRGAYESELAWSLNNLAASLSAFGQPEAALGPVEEAVEIRRRLATADPDAYEPDLAMSLNNLGAFLSLLGRHEAALGPTEEAAGLYSKLAAADPDVYEPDLAMSLDNLGNCLRALGQLEPALGPAEKAAKLYGKLAAANPGAYEPDLAISLNNWAASLSAFGQPEAALGPVEEALEIRRRLATADPDAYEPALAGSLNNLGACLLELGRPEAAFRAAKEAVEIRRKLATANPDVHEPALAGSLNNLGNCLRALGRHGAALGPAEKAAGLYRKLAAANSDAYEPELAVSLMTFADGLDAAGDHERAIEQNCEAIRLYTRHFLMLPEAFVDRARAMVADYLERCEELGREPDAELLSPIVKVLERMRRTDRRVNLPETDEGDSNLQERMEDQGMDPVTLAGAAVALVAPYLAEGGKELAKKVGGEAGERILKLYDKVKAKLIGGGAEALADLEQQPQDADTQATLRVQLKKALEADPAFQAELATLVEEIKAKGGDQIIQTANVTGDQNVTTQIAGSGNVVR